MRRCTLHAAKLLIVHVADNCSVAAWRSPSIQRHHCSTRLQSVPGTNSWCAIPGTVRINSNTYAAACVRCQVLSNMMVASARQWYDNTFIGGISYLVPATWYGLYTWQYEGTRSRCCLEYPLYPTPPTLLSTVFFRHDYYCTPLAACVKG